MPPGCLRLANSAAASPTGAKIRAIATSGTVGNLFACALLGAAIARSGRQAVTNPTFASRASDALLEAVKLSRALMSGLAVQKCFKGLGLSSSFPEVGLLFLAADGSYSLSPLHLKMSQGKRNQMESELAMGLGLGSRASRTINPSIAEAATADIGLGFVRLLRSSRRGGRNSMSGVIGPSSFPWLRWFLWHAFLVLFHGELQRA